MLTIYEPAGAAKEYAPLALNIYRGCTHACRYCYVPGILRTTPAEFHSKVQIRTGLLSALQHEARKYQGDPRRVHLCFTCDPWPDPRQFRDDEMDYTLEVLNILADYDIKVQTLTKAPLRAQSHLKALLACDAKFGITLAWTDDEKRAEWEPGTPGEEGLSVMDRLDGLLWARAAGLKTWASIEPVIDPREGLAAIEMLMPIVDEIKVGKLNHMNHMNAGNVDWTAFAREADAILNAWGRPYMLKLGLVELLTK